MYTLQEKSSIYMNETPDIKKQYCHKCGNRHWANEECFIETKTTFTEGQPPLTQEIVTPESRYIPVPVCPVCAERRKKNAARMKRYRDKRRTKL